MDSAFEKGTKTTPYRMKKEITIGQLLSVAATLVIAMATGWITMSNKVTKSDARLDALEAMQRQDKIDYTRSIEELKWKVEDGNSRIIQILIKLENKKDRGK